MNLLCLSKYPPIQGGESARAYWLLKALGERGHSISVVSNCMEVEDQYRCHLDDDAIENLQPKGVKIYSSFPVGQPHFIPQTNPYTEKLVSLALEAAAVREPDVVLGWYLLPYGTAAYMTATLLGKRFLLKHAGSDLTRLFHDPYLHPFLKRLVTDADGILTTARLQSFFQELGCRRIYSIKPSFPEAFNPSGNPASCREEFGIDVDPNRTFLFLGKLTPPKGLGYLLNAVSHLRTEFCLLVAGDGPHKAECERKVRGLKLENRVHFLGMLPPWKIPSLIRAVKSVVIPEHEFGVPIHLSGLPYETLLCGKVPVVSNQVSDKYGALSKYFVVVPPTDAEAFANGLERSLGDERLNTKIAGEIDRIRELVGDYEEYVRKIETALNELATC